MIADELRATATLGGRVVTDVASLVQGVHRAVAGRAFGAFGPAGRPFRVVHDTVSSAVYEGVRWGTRAAATAVGEALFVAGPASAPAGRTRWGNQTVAALNAFAGDRLARENNALALRTAVRVGGRDLPLEPVTVSGAFAEATPRLAVLVHGLAETEMSWAARAGDPSRVDFGQRLRDELGYTPVYVRYNTGRHVSDNGAELSRLLEELLGCWPTPPEEVALVGHSMGGLVIRAACHRAVGDGLSWPDLVRHVVYLGTPHLGAPLARAAGLAGWSLARLPETRPFAPLVNGTSDGVKDLRYGYLREEDWSGCDPDHCRRDHRGDVPLLGSANHYVFGVTVSADPHGLTGRLVGDLLVLPASAHGRRRGRHRSSIAFPVEGRRLHGGLHHFDLLHHPTIWREMRTLLSSESPDKSQR